MRITLLRRDDNPQLWDESVDRFLHTMYNLVQGRKDVPVAGEVLAYKLAHGSLNYLDAKSIDAIARFCRDEGFVHKEPKKKHNL